MRTSREALGSPVSEMPVDLICGKGHSVESERKLIEISGHHFDFEIDYFVIQYRKQP